VGLKLHNDARYYTDMISIVHRASIKAIDRSPVMFEVCYKYSCNRKWFSKVFWSG